jgi:hypothetical protein
MGATSSAVGLLRPIYGRPAILHGVAGLNCPQWGLTGVPGADIS